MSGRDIRTIVEGKLAVTKTETCLQAVIDALQAILDDPQCQKDMGSRYAKCLDTEKRSIGWTKKHIAQRRTLDLTSWRELLDVVPVAQEQRCAARHEIHMAEKRGVPLEAHIGDEITELWGPEIRERVDIATLADEIRQQAERETKRYVHRKKKAA